MKATEKIHLYRLCKMYIEKDWSKRDIKELAISKFSSFVDSDFEECFSEAFSSI